MLRACKSADYRAFLEPDDHAFLGERIDHAAWYPMATFERFGNAILKFVANGELMPVQLWGRYTAAQLATQHPMLVAPGDAVETMNRFRVMRETFFDFSALEIQLLHDDEAHIAVGYYMGKTAEEAASHQTLGFFEGLLPLAGADQIQGSIRTKSWEGAPRTLLVLRWRPKL
jgi:hypothetical protein